MWYILDIEGLWFVEGPFKTKEEATSSSSYDRWSHTVKPVKKFQIGLFMGACHAVTRLTEHVGTEANLRPTLSHLGHPGSDGKWVLIAKEFDK